MSAGEAETPPPRPLAAPLGALPSAGPPLHDPGAVVPAPAATTAAPGSIPDVRFSDLAIEPTELARLLGQRTARGSFGTAFRATLRTASGAEVPVVAKLLRGARTPPEDFRHEAQVLGRIASAMADVAAKTARGERLSDAEVGAAHFVRVHGVAVGASAEGLGLPPDDAEGAAYAFVFEPLEATLEEVMLHERGGLLPVTDALVALMHASRGIAFLHRLGIVVSGGGGPREPHTAPCLPAPTPRACMGVQHGDVKLANLMGLIRSLHGVRTIQWKLIDVGLARLLGVRDAPGQAGSPVFWSPELLVDEAQRNTPASDVCVREMGRELAYTPVTHESVPECRPSCPLLLLLLPPLLQLRPRAAHLLRAYGPQHALAARRRL